MKKTYINPVMDVVKVQSQNLLVGSNPEAGFSKDSVGTINATSGNMARDYDFDDED